MSTPHVPGLHRGASAVSGEEALCRAPTEGPVGKPVPSHRSALAEVLARGEVLIQGRATHITTVTCSPALAYAGWARGGYTIRVYKVCAEQS